MSLTVFRTHFRLQRRRRSSSRSPRRRSYSPVSREHSKSPRHRSSHRPNKRRFNRPPYDRINRTARFMDRDVGSLKRDSTHSRVRGTLRTKTIARRVRNNRDSPRLSDNRDEDKKSDVSEGKSYDSDKESKLITDKRRVYRGNRRTPDNVINYISNNSDESDYSSQGEKREEKVCDKMVTKFDKSKERRKKSKKHKKKQKKSKRIIGEGKALTMYSESPSSDESTPDFSSKAKSQHSEEFSIKATTIAPPKIASPSPVQSSEEDEKEDKRSDCSRTPDMSKSPRGEKCLTPQLFNGAGNERQNDDSVSLLINEKFSDDDESDVSSAESFDDESKSSHNLEELRKAYKEKEKEIRLLKKERADAKARRKAKKHKKKEKKVKEEKAKKKKKKIHNDTDEGKRKKQHKRSYQHMNADDQASEKPAKSSKRSKHSKRDKAENGNLSKEDVQFKVNITPIKNMPKSPSQRKHDARRVHINVKKSSRSSSSKSSKHPKSL